MKQLKPPRIALYEAVALGLILGSFLAILAPQIRVLGDSLRTIWHADITFLAWALLAATMSYVTAALTYYILAHRPIRFWPTVLVQLADGFTNRLLPASLGGVATNFLYLIKQRHTKTYAGYVVAADDFLGFVGHVLILVLLLVTSPQTANHLFVWYFPTRYVLGLVGLSIIVVTYLAVVKHVDKLAQKTLASVAGAASYVFARPIIFLKTLLSSMATTLTYTSILYFSMLAVNVHVSVLQTFLVLSIGVLSIAITPTPGGIGGAEAGLAAGLTSMGVSAHQALSAALLYRFITFWLPIIPGFIALQILLKRNLIKLN